MMMAARCSIRLFTLVRTKSSQNVLSPASKRLFSTRNNFRFFQSTFSPMRFSFNNLSRSSFFSERSSKAKILSDEMLNESFTKQSSNADENSSNKSSEEDEKSKLFAKKMMKLSFVAFGAMFTTMMGYAIHEWGAPPTDEDGNILEDEFSHMITPKAYLLRTYKEMKHYDKLIKEPSREKLLPDPMNGPYYQPPYTLAFEMNGILVHPDWTYQTGWRFKKRPGVDYFFQQVAPLFELVIFTSENPFTAFPLIESLDSKGYIMYKLFRDATRYVDGHHVKDLSCLNRDLSKLLFIDWNPQSVKLQPRNVLILEKWSGNDDDKTLYDLANLLRAIATSEVEDVRTVLDHYSQFDDPIAAFKENQRRLQEEEEKRMLDGKNKMPGLASTWSSNLLRWR